MSELAAEYKNEIPYGDIHRAFKETDFAASLAEPVRFERFKPSHLSNQEWVKLLGHDADSLLHMPVTYGLARAFLNECRAIEFKTDQMTFTEEQEAILLLAAMTNNWGESKIGNISFDQKTVDLESAEKDAFREIFAKVCGEVVDVKLRMLVERTLFDKHSKTGQVFDAIQRVGYLRTALHAYEQSKEVTDPDTVGRLQWLCANVLSNQIMMLVEFSNTYPPIKKFLVNQHQKISEAFEALQPDLFVQYGQKESIRSELFMQNKRSWYEFNKYEVDDLKHEIISLVVGALANDRVFNEIDKGLETLLTLYAKAVASKNSSTNTRTEFFDGGLFGNASNFEARFIDNYQDLERKIAAIRELGLKIVLTSGSFDLLHIGHVGYIEKAKQYGDVLIVGVDSDEKMKSKGPDRPMVPQTERTRMLAHQRGVDIITIKPANEEKWSLIKLICPDTLITTQETYTDKEIRQLHEYCGRVVVLPPQATTSTSAKIRRMNLGFGQKFLEAARESITNITITDYPDKAALQQQLFETLETVLEEVVQNA